MKHFLHIPYPIKKDSSPPPIPAGVIAIQDPKNLEITLFEVAPAYDPDSKKTSYTVFIYGDTQLSTDLIIFIGPEDDKASEASSLRFEAVVNPLKINEMEIAHGKIRLGDSFTIHQMTENPYFEIVKIMIQGISLKKFQSPQKLLPHEIISLDLKKIITNEFRQSRENEIPLLHIFENLPEEPEACHIRNIELITSYNAIDQAREIIGYKAYISGPIYGVIKWSQEIMPTYWELEDTIGLSPGVPLQEMKELQGIASHLHQYTQDSPTHFLP